MYNSLKAFVQDLTRFQVGLSESREFGILHYAGPSLHSGQLLRQEKDVQQDQLFELMYNSLKAFVQDLTRFQVGLSESR